MVLHFKPFIFVVIFDALLQRNVYKLYILHKYSNFGNTTCRCGSFSVKRCGNWSCQSAMLTGYVSPDILSTATRENVKRSYLALYNETMDRLVVFRYTPRVHCVVCRIHHHHHHHSRHKCLQCSWLTLVMRTSLFVRFFRVIVNRQCQLSFLMKCVQCAVRTCLCTS